MRLIAVLLILLTSACAHLRCESMLTSLGPEDNDYYFSFEQHIIDFPGAANMPIEVRHELYEETLNHYLDQVVGDYSCHLIPHSLKIGVQEPITDARVHCAKPLPLRLDRITHTRDGRVFYRHCIPPRPSAK